MSDIKQETKTETPQPETLSDTGSLPCSPDGPEAAIEELQREVARLSGKLYAIYHITKPGPRRDAMECAVDNIDEIDADLRKLAEKITQHES